MSKDTTISLRVDARWKTIADEATQIRSRQLGVPVSRNTFIELAVLAYIEQLEAEQNTATGESDYTELAEAMMGVMYDDPQSGAAYMQESEE